MLREIGDGQVLALNFFFQKNSIYFGKVSKFIL